MTWVRLRLSMVPVWPELEKTALSSCYQRPVSSFSASMEMNESSRWTEEEMETAKKGERCLAALMALDLHPGPAGSVVGRTLTHQALLGSAVLWEGRLCFWALLRLVTSPWSLSFALQKMGLYGHVRLHMVLLGHRSCCAPSRWMAPCGASTPRPCRQSSGSAPGHLGGGAEPAGSHLGPEGPAVLPSAAPSWGRLTAKCQSHILPREPPAWSFEPQ